MTEMKIAIIPLSDLNIGSEINGHKVKQKVLRKIKFTVTILC